MAISPQLAATSRSPIFVRFAVIQVCSTVPKMEHRGNKIAVQAIKNAGNWRCSDDLRGEPPTLLQCATATSNGIFAIRTTE